MARRIKCAVCGEIFISNSWNASLCSDKCRKEKQVNNSRLARQRAREEMKEGSQIYDARKKPPKFKSTMRQLTNDAIEAHKRGMSYGKYIALVKGRTGRGV